MIIYIVGISCVGKTTIGKMLAEKIGFSFYDLDEEIQNYYQKPIERIQDECLKVVLELRNFWLHFLGSAHCSLYTRVNHNGTIRRPLQRCTGHHQ